MLKRVLDIVHNVYSYNFASSKKIIRHVKDILAIDKFLIERKSRVSVTFSWAIWLINIDKVSVVLISNNDEGDLDHIFL